MMKHQVFVFVGVGVGLGEALVGAVDGEPGELEPVGVVELVAGAVDFEALAVADFDAEEEGLDEGCLLAEATGTWMMEVAPTE